MKVRVGKNSFAVVDQHDHARISVLRWTLKTQPSGDKCARLSTGPTIYMHHLVIGIPTDGLVVDHINGDGLDNRRVNLRFCTKAENCRNQVKRRKIKTSSRFKGVTWDKNRGKWLASITLNRKRHNLGRFTTEREAATAYNSAATRLFAKFAKLNAL